MDNPSPCCKTIGRDLIAGPIPLPRFRCMALGYYDGPTVGVITCMECGSEYLYEMLELGDGEDVRIFAVSSLPRGSFEGIVAILPAGQYDPSWRRWSPIWKFESEDARAAADAEMARILGARGPVELVVAWAEGESLMTARTVTPEEVRPGVDWFEFLNVSRAALFG